MVGRERESRRVEVVLLWFDSDLRISSRFKALMMLDLEVFRAKMRCLLENILRMSERNGGVGGSEGDLWCWTLLLK